MSATCRPSRGLGFQIRNVHGLTPNGVEVLWNPLNRWVKTREGEAPAEPPIAGSRSERLPAILRSSGGRRSPCGRDAAQQELRPPGTPSCQKVKAIGLPPMAAFCRPSRGWGTDQNHRTTREVSCFSPSACVVARGVGGVLSPRTAVLRLTAYLPADCRPAADEPFSLDL